jgi:excisionase family DNA binding protein
LTITFLWTPETLAEYLGVRVKTVHQHVRDGELACVQFGRHRRFTQEQVDQFISQHMISAKHIDKDAPDVLPFPRKGGEGKKSSGDFDEAQLRREMRLWH